MKAIVIKGTGSWYRVEELETHDIYNCRIRGKMRMAGIRSTNPITVGDIVNFDVETSEKDLVGVITSVDKRRNYVIRRAINLSKESHIIAANVDMAYLVATIDFPMTNTEFIDRFIVSCEMYRVPVTILLNKIDLFKHEDYREFIDEFKAPYLAAGYNVIEVSAVEGTNIKELDALMSDNISLFAGNSGVGKSTLINALVPGLNIKSGEISEMHKTGKHTTTFSEMFKIGDNKYLVDTPGIKGFGLLDVSKEELAMYMPDLFGRSRECGFANCTHTHEPKCAVKDAVKSGELSAVRYDSYVKMASDLEDDKVNYR